MSTKTQNYGFVKPDPTEFYDVAVQNDNWDRTEAEFSKRISRTTAPITYYVRTDGNDNNDGSANDTAHAFKTIGKAINMLPKYLLHDITIRLSAGTYLETVSIGGFTGVGAINIIGGNSYADALNYVIKNVISFRNACKIYLQGITMNTIIDPAVNSLSDQMMYLRNCRTNGITSQWGFIANEGSTMYVVECEVSNKQIGIVAQGSFVLSYANSGSGNTTALYAFDGGRLATELGQPTGIVLQQNQGSGGSITNTTLGVSVWGGWRRYASLTELGLTSATVTPVSLSNAMTDLSEITFSISGINALGLQQSYWQVTAIRTAYNFVRFTAVGDVGTAHSGYRLEGTYNNDVGFSGWISNGTQIGDVVYYVRPDGNDLNDGLMNTAARAFKTISAAIKTIPRTVNGYITINVADGTYAEQVSLFGYTGAGTISIQGNVPAAGNVKINNVLVVGCTISVIMGGFKCTKTDATAIQVYRSICVGLTNFDLTTASSWIGIYAEFSKVRASGCDISNRSSAAIQSHMHGEILIENCVGSNNTTGIYATYGGKISKAGTVPTGITPESCIYGGIITGAPYTLTIAGGYAAGWSNAIFAHKTLGNVVTVTINLYKSSDINIQEVVYTLPVGYRPAVTRSVATFAHNEVVGIVMGNQTMVEIQPNGNVLVTPSGTMTGTRRLWNVTVTYTAS